MHYTECGILMYATMLRMLLTQCYILLITTPGSPEHPTAVQGMSVGALLMQIYTDHRAMCRGLCADFGTLATGPCAEIVEGGWSRAGKMRELILRVL